MCSIFRNRINYRGTPGSNSPVSPVSLTKDLEAADSNNNDNNDNNIMSRKSESPIETRESNRKSPVAETKNDEYNTEQIDEIESEEKMAPKEDEEIDRDRARETRVHKDEALDLSVLPNGLPTKGHVSLEALQHTKVAVAQFAATALAQTPYFGEGANDLTTILNVQRQHLMQLQFIQHLQSQLKRRDQARECGEEDDGQEEEEEQERDDIVEPMEEDGDEDDLNEERLQQEELDLSSRKYGLRNNIDDEKKNGLESNAILREENLKTDKNVLSKSPKELDDKVQSPNYQPLLSGISSTLASTIITNHDPIPPPHEPNCLEMLQRRTEEVLDSASQSLHASQMQEEYEYIQKDGQGRGEIFKHRCKYCGKIFGSFSALQIHLRSHTGERPFVCNVCGSKFTTKGNLKVHYQRHTQIYPPILMPPGVGPPLELPPSMREPIGSQTQHSLPHQQTPTLPPPPPSALTVNNLNNMPFKLSYNEKPLTKDSEEDNEIPMDTKESEISIEEREKEFSPEAPKVPEEHPEDLSKPSKEEEPKAKPLVRVKTPQALMEPAVELPTEKLDRPAMSLTPKRSNSQRKRSSTAGTPPQELRKISLENDVTEHHLSKLYRRSSLSRNSSLEHLSGDFCQVEQFVDKSWEDLIEIDTTSETSKLQQLVDNIENKLTDPNQCIFCQKIMSCRSSLQMHIRTHTGERPFRCKICGRAFATKGNLKAHMSIHKIKPPMRSQFKCPVCHQKFSNGIILQQHIRIHTIDDGSGGCGSQLLGQSSEMAAAIAEHNNRMRAHMEAAILEDQNSQKSLGASENLDFSTTSEYSGQRSESSQGDFDEYMTMESTDDSRENSASATPLDKRISEDGDDKLEQDGERPDSAAIDLTSRNASLQSQKPLDHLPHLMGMPHNLWLMAAAREEIQNLGNHGKFPLLPFGPLGFMGLPPQAHICQLCFKLFPSPSALETHFQNDHTKDSVVEVTTTVAATTTMTSSASVVASATGNSTTTTTTVTSANDSNSNNNESLANENFDKNCDSITELSGTPTYNKLSLNPNLFPKYKTPSDEDQNSRKTPFERRSSNSNEDPRDQHKKVQDLEPLKNHIKSEPFMDAEDIAAKSPHMIDDMEEEDDVFRNTSTSPSLYAPHVSALNHPHADNSEHSLMKMQMLTTIPHQFSTSHPTMSSHIEAHRFPATPLDFQQALMSVGPPASSLDPPVNNKHFCHICRRNFSSSSALQIHMRTHTGDKPFQCNVCQKAFTTKGNLKVHMGTHMWSNPTSRRGRRMSLELPMHRPGGGLASESDFLPRRPDIFFPYLPPFFNGLPPKPGDLNSAPPFPSHLNPQHLANGTAGPPKYPPGLPMGFPPFLQPPYNFNPMLNHSPTSSALERQTKTPLSAEREMGDEEPKNTTAAQTHPSPKHHSSHVMTNEKSDSPPISTAWNPMIKIKTENNQNDINHLVDHNAECSNQD